MLSASCVVFVLISILCLVVAGKVLPGWLTWWFEKGYRLVLAWCVRKFLPVEPAGLVCEKVYLFSRTF
jgi:hypothetical protein